jgi:hypothetical protein
VSVGSVVTGTKCGLCDGRRHVLEGGVWKPCECLARERTTRLLRAARIPRRHDLETWRTFLEVFRAKPNPKELLGAARSLRAGSRPDDLVLDGDEVGREIAVALLLRQAVAAGMKTELLELRRLIDFEFDKELGDPYLVPVVALRLGTETKHPWNQRVLEKLLRVRADDELPTFVVVGDVNSTATHYGHVVAAAFGSFRSIEIEKKS